MSQPPLPETAQLPTAVVKAPPASPLKNAVLGIVALLVVVAAGWYVYRQVFPPEYSFGIPDDQLVTNHTAITAAQLLDLPLIDAGGQPVSLRDRLGNKHLVIVFTRGSLRSVPWNRRGPVSPEFPQVCAYCSSQASGIAGQMAEFEKQDAEVMLIFPVQQKVEFADSESLRAAASNPATKTPPAILLDMNCAAVDRLKIREHLARPSSFIIDKAGQLRFAYVAAADKSVDRPSGTELLRHVTQVNLDFEK